MLPFKLVYRFQIITTYNKNKIKSEIESILEPTYPYPNRVSGEHFRGKVNMDEFKIKTFGMPGRSHISIICHGVVSDLNKMRVINVDCNSGIYPWYALSILFIINMFCCYCVLKLEFESFSGIVLLGGGFPLIILLIIYLLFVFKFNNRIKKIEDMLKIKLSKE